MIIGISFYVLKFFIDRNNIYFCMWYIVDDLNFFNCLFEYLLIFMFISFFFFVFKE